MIINVSICIFCFSLFDSLPIQCISQTAEPSSHTDRAQKKPPHLQRKAHKEAQKSPESVNGSVGCYTMGCRNCNNVLFHLVPANLLFSEAFTAVANCSLIHSCVVACYSLEKTWVESSSVLCCRSAQCQTHYKEMSVQMQIPPTLKASPHVVYIWNVLWRCSPRSEDLDWQYSKENHAISVPKRLSQAEISISALNFLAGVS